MGTAVKQKRDTNSGNTGRLGTALRESDLPERATTDPYQKIAESDRGTGGQTNADLLGYFSLGLGLAELLAPNLMSRLIGVKHPDETNRATMRVMGAREITAGIGILASQQPAKAVWARVAGDALDLALLGKTLANSENDRGRTLFAAVNVLAVTALDITTARQLSEQPQTKATEKAAEGIIVTKRSVTIQRPVAEVYSFWHNFENLPRFMRHLKSVTVTGNGRSHWVALAPAGQTVEWDAETVEDRPNECISWKSLPGSDVRNSGTVNFRAAPGNRGTEVRVVMQYDPPFGKLGSKIAMLWREEPRQQVHDDLRHLKQVMETGEILFSDSTKQRGMHPAQPDNKPVQL